MSQRAIDQGQIGVVGSGGGITGDRTTDPFGGSDGVALLVDDNSKQVQQVGVLWLGGQEVTIPLGCLIQEAALVLLDGQC